MRAVPYSTTLVACSPIVVATLDPQQWHGNCASAADPEHQCQCSIFRAACRRVCCRKRSAFDSLSRLCEGAVHARRCSSLPAHLLWCRPRSLDEASLAAHLCVIRRRQRYRRGGSFRERNSPFARTRFSPLYHSRQPFAGESPAAASVLGARSMSISHDNVE